VTITKVFLGLVVTLLLTTSGWCQTDPQGRALAWQLFEANEAGESNGDYSQFERLFMSDPQLTRRAFVSAVEYATEVYQADMNAAGEALTFANGLAELIAGQLGDPAPSQLMQKLMRKDPSVMSDLLAYATALYPGYASSAASAYGPGGQYGPTTTAPGTQGPGAQYGPTTSGPGAYGPGPGPGPGPNQGVDYDQDDDFSPNQPGGNPSTGPGYTYPPSTGPFRPANATGGPPKE
jgi:hypothetical protein